MSAPADIVEVILISSATACAVVSAAVAFLRRWGVDIERRLAAIEASSGALEDGAAGSPVVAPSTFEPALFELRCALSLFDVADDIVRQRSKDGAVASERETTGRAYAAWTLAGAARRLASAYVRDTEAGTRI